MRVSYQICAASAPAYFFFFFFFFFFSWTCFDLVADSPPSGVYLTLSLIHI